MISDAAVNEINSLNAVDVAKRLGLKVVRRGSVHMACCLWHPDDHPSLQVGGKDKYRSMVKCHACGTCTNIVGLIREALGCDFREAMQWASDEFGITLDEEQRTQQPRRRWPRPLWCLPREEKSVRHYLGGIDWTRFTNLNNALSRILKHYFDDAVVDAVTMDYHLGCNEEMYHCEHTMFPSVDVEGRLHNIKLQGYVTSPESPRFGHSTKCDTQWIGKEWREKGLIPATCEIDTECLFGEHLLARYPSRVVGLVESPKNAVVAACYRPDMVWVATGNKGQLKASLLEVLRGRQVLVFPDRDAEAEWREKLRHMQSIATFIICHIDPTDDSGKDDIADAILRNP